MQEIDKILTSVSANVKSFTARSDAALKVAADKTAEAEAINKELGLYLIGVGQDLVGKMPPKVTISESTPEGNQDRTAQVERTLKSKAEDITKVVLEANGRLTTLVIAQKVGLSVDETSAIMQGLGLDGARVFKPQKVTTEQLNAIQAFCGAYPRRGSERKQAVKQLAQQFALSPSTIYHYARLCNVAKSLAA